MSTAHSNDRMANGAFYAGSVSPPPPLPEAGPGSKAAGVGAGSAGNGDGAAGGAAGGGVADSVGDDCTAPPLVAGGSSSRTLTAANKIGVNPRRQRCRLLLHELLKKSFVRRSSKTTCVL